MREFYATTAAPPETQRITGSDVVRMNESIECACDELKKALRDSLVGRT